MARMTPSEAFVETLVANGVTKIFGIMGSAFMDAMDIFAPAGIELIPVVHEQGAAHMADGYSRASGEHGVPDLFELVGAVGACCRRRSGFDGEVEGPVAGYAGNVVAERTAVHGTRRGPKMFGAGTAVVGVGGSSLFAAAFVAHGDPFLGSELSPTG